MAFDLSDYKTVPERIAEAKARYPEGRFQTEVLTIPDHPGYVAVKARFFRTQDDPTPGEGLAWEVVPGRTPYTKDSELQNAETSAWGRALVAAFAVDASKGVASREEVQSRREEAAPRPRSGMKRTPGPRGDGEILSPPTVTITDPYASQNPANGSQTHLTPEQALEIAGIKKSLLGRLGGDKAEAKRLWDGTLESFGLNPEQPLPANMIGAIEHSIKALIIKGED